MNFLLSKDEIDNLKNVLGGIAELAEEEHSILHKYRLDYSPSGAATLL